MAEQFYFQANHINKIYPGVKALDDVTIEAKKGEVLGVIGINGAGKSTFMNVLAGEIKADRGTFVIDGAEKKLENQKDSEKNKIALIHQEAVVFKDLTVAENIFIYSLNKFRRHGLVQYRRMRKEAARYLAMIGSEINPGTLVRDITVGERQMVEIARALSRDAEIVLFDEPTSSLSMEEKENLFKIIAALKKQNKIVMYITHFLDEVLRICDRAVVMRDGRVVGNTAIEQLNSEDLITMMVGYSVETVVNRKEPPETEAVLEVKNLTRAPRVNNVSFTLKRGEILGLWGLLGSGRTEIVRAMFDLDRPESGSVWKISREGKMEKISGHKLLLETAYITEDRHQDGLFLSMPLWKNITMASLDRFSRGFMQEKEEHQYSRELIDKLMVKTPDENVAADKLSGGNQQKVIMARWVGKKPDIFFIDEPTRGVDVGAKAFIHKTILELAAAGSSVVLISSEIEENLNLCDRVLIVKNGTITAEVQKKDINKQNLMNLCIG